MTDRKMAPTEVALGRTRLLGAVAGGRASIFPLFYRVYAGVHLFFRGFGWGG
jgi:hypothetical protein